MMFQARIDKLTDLPKNTQIQGPFWQKTNTGPVPEFCNILIEKQPP